LRLLRRADQTVEACVRRQSCQTQHLLLWFQIEADIGQVRLLHAGQYRDADKQRAGPVYLVQGIATRGHHPPAAGAVNVDHPDTQLRCGADRHRRGVGNVMEFQVEKHLKSLKLQRFDNLRTTAGEQFLADLDAA